MSRFHRKPSLKPPAEADCYTMTISEFAARHRISKQFYYKLRAAGQGPTEMRIGSRVLISKDAAEAWRAKMEGQNEREPTDI